ncbi:uncharacterized protein MYCFIDRAFT_170299 [Pseudocercospora fijiensis CIRAD86]|uniref:Uncharacterized protein n=1 Tax=Pseudocercospora fijiensis (strain CIRAD86) TaxID=383855 RepID=N1Q7M3_PSEFD|nr:uncharacterized protein MYCFIDRAFT_170299 [Pseudocercospora fijiensis CIRAD86]EME88715.1 hypothetical protein MYCFIDRAFT_170299 [Pseudocercospora fijiensis CIRAD86]
MEMLGYAMLCHARRTTVIRAFPHYLRREKFKQVRSTAMREGRGALRNLVALYYGWGMIWDGRVNGWQAFYDAYEIWKRRSWEGGAPQGAEKRHFT